MARVRPGHDISEDRVLGANVGSRWDRKSRDRFSGSFYPAKRSEGLPAALGVTGSGAKNMVCMDEAEVGGVGPNAESGGNDDGRKE